jgi:hypothetical protein
MTYIFTEFKITPERIGSFCHPPQNKFTVILRERAGSEKKEKYK